MAINPNAPVMPEVDVALLVSPGDVRAGAPYPGFDEVLIPNEQAQPEVDITLLPGVPGQRGPTGPAGPGASDQQILEVIPAAVAYNHVQNASSTTWTIIHNLKFLPNVTAFDSSGTQVEGNVVHSSINQLTIEFSAAISGNAVLS